MRRFQYQPCRKIFYEAFKPLGSTISSALETLVKVTVFGDGAQRDSEENGNKTERVEKLCNRC